MAAMAMGLLPLKPCTRKAQDRCARAASFPCGGHDAVPLPPPPDELKMTPLVIVDEAGLPSGVETVKVNCPEPPLLATLTVIVTVLLPRPAIDAEVVQMTVCPELVAVQPGVVEA